MIRTMKLDFLDKSIYESAFDTENGTLTRIVENFNREKPFLVDSLFPEIEDYNELKKIRDQWREIYSGRQEPFSPSPESVDLSITDWCNFGCDFCYQDSLPILKHAPKNLIVDVIQSFTTPPYQIAIGGGEPTSHPNLPEILESARHFNTVPNFTTAGHIHREEVFEATNRFCGGVSLTFHAFKGIEYFKETYKLWKNKLEIPLNVQLIADKNVATNLDALNSLTQFHPLSIILLAYYPNVGRSKIRDIMPKKVYNIDLPEAIKKSLEFKNTIAFSEGLLPYFFSRPELGVSTEFAERSEGLYSCYVDPRGRLSRSSFDPPFKPGDPPWFGTLEEFQTSQLERNPTLYEKTLQEQWNKLSFHNNPIGDICDYCRFENRCSTPNINHYFACAFAEHNGKPQAYTDAYLRSKEIEDHNEKIWDEIDELEKKLGRKLTKEEYAQYDFKQRDYNDDY